MSEPDFRKMGDPMNDRLPPNDNLLNRRRRKDLARIVGPRTLDGENVCTRCGVPDVHCQCDDRIDYDAQFDEGTARDDYDIRPIWASDRLGQIIDQHHAMCDEIDRLQRRELVWAASGRWCHDWITRATNLLGGLRDDLEHELAESGHLAELEQLLADDFEDGDDV